MMHARKELLENLYHNRAWYLTHTLVEGTNTSKWMLRCDATAELTCRKEVERLAKEDNVDVQVYGEESLWDIIPDEPIVLTKSHPSVILLDMIDGSDLLERDLGNWCSAAVLFDPKEGRILTSIIQDSHNDIYFATEHGAWFIKVETQRDADGKYHLMPSQSVPLGGPHHPFPPGKPRDIDDNYASICFYGQKGGHFVELPGTFRAWLSEKERPDDPRSGLRFRGRLYTLAGNPMMAKLANGDRIHVVFEHIGQYAHDAVPGLFIALKSGATALRLQDEPDYEDKQKGTRVTESDLGRSLYTPCKQDGLAYVLATTDQLAGKIFTALTGLPLAKAKSL